MCFGRHSRDLGGDMAARIPPTDNEAKNETLDSRGDNVVTSKNESPKDERGESLGLDLFAQRQKRLREAYPDGNIPKEMQRFNESGMVQGNLGGPLGGGAGMAMSGGF